MENTGNSKKNSFWQRFNNSKKTDNFLKGGKYFWFFVLICCLIDIITRSSMAGEISGPQNLFFVIFGFLYSFGYAIFFMLFGHVKKNEFKSYVVEGGTGCSATLLIIFTVVGIIAWIIG